MIAFFCGLIIGAFVAAWVLAIARVSARADELDKSFERKMRE